MKFIYVTMVQLGIISLTICYCVFHFNSNESSESLLEIASKNSFDSYKDLWTTASYYRQAIILDALILILMCIVILRFLRIIPTVNFFFKVLAESLRIFAPQMVVLIILLVCYAIIASQIWSSVYYGFKDIGNSMIYILFIFELSTGETKIDLYDEFAFGHEKFFALVLIVLMVSTILSLTVTTAIVVKSFDRQILFFEHAQENTKPPHYLIQWLKTAKLDRMICLHKCKRNSRQDVYERDSKDEANLEMIRNVNIKNI
jgi:hypothetical protein